jgi:monothiol glutaredoxin
MGLDDKTRAKLDQIIRGSDVVLFMKGTRRAPQCGFSATVVQILDELVPSYETVDVLSDPAIRDGIKAFSSWPTIPQLYVRGEFVGGCDIVREMHASGDLPKMLGVSPAQEAGPPVVKVSEAAARAFKDAAEGDELIHVEVSPRFEYSLALGARGAADIEVRAGGLTFLFDPASARRVRELSIDFVEGPGGAGFKLESPDEPPRVKQISAAELKAMMDRGDPLELFDVRTEKERAIAKIAGARHLDDAGRRHVEALDKETRLVFHCHHGGRSQAAAEHYLAQGFKHVYNVKGGIDAWSVSVDASVPRY